MGGRGRDFDFKILKAGNKAIKYILLNDVSQDHGHLNISILSEETSKCPFTIV